MQNAREAVIHNQHVNTILDLGCDIFLGVYDKPHKKHVGSRQPTNEVMKLEGQLIESTPGAMKLRDTANDKKNSHKNLEKSDASWNQAKKRVSLVDGACCHEESGQMSLKSFAGARSFPSGGQGISDIGWRSGHIDQAKNCCDTHQVLTDTPVCGSPGTSLFKSGGLFSSR